MDELLNMPFDQLWSRTTRTTRTSRRTVEGGPYTMPIPEIDYEALLALGRPQMVMNVFFSQYFISSFAILRNLPQNP